MNSLTIKSRLILILSAVLVVSFVFTSYVNYQASRSAVLKELTTSALPLTRDTIYSEILKSLIEPIHVSSLMANDAFLKAWSEDGEKDGRQIKRYLEDIHRKYGYFSTFFVSSMTRKYYHYKGVLKKVSPFDTHDIWYYRFVDSALDFDLDVDTNEADRNELTVFVNYRVKGKRGQTLGVAGVGLKVDMLSKLIKRTQEQYKRRIYLVDTVGVIQAHTNQGLVDKTDIHKLPGIGEVARRILTSRDKPTNFRYKTKDGTILLTSRYIKELNWFLLVEQGETEALRPARANLIRTLAVGLFVSLVIITIMVFVVNRFQGRLESMAVTDELTGLYNRRAFDEAFELACQRSARMETTFCLMLLDLDNFKHINDTLGHLEGDRVLKLVANTIDNEIRPTDTLARWGGDEFVVLAECSMDDAGTVAMRIASAVQEMQVMLRDRCPLSISCGVAEYQPGEKLDDLLARADKRMFEAKEAGRGSVHC